MQLLVFSIDGDRGYPHVKVDCPLEKLTHGFEVL